MSQVPEVTAFQAEVHRLAAEILVSPVAYAVAGLAHRAVVAQAAQIARLEAELDRYRGRTVFHCTDAALDYTSARCLDAQPGDILRATDTGRELRFLGGGEWEPL